jgi:hypothetical protein
VPVTPRGCLAASDLPVPRRLRVVHARSAPGKRNVSGGLYERHLGIPASCRGPWAVRCVHRAAQQPGPLMEVGCQSGASVVIVPPEDAPKHRDRASSGGRPEGRKA